MRNFNRKFNNNTKTADGRFFRINESIRFSPVLLVDQDGQNVGSVSVDDAKARAKTAGLDLVEVSPNSRPPVCRIMDFGKFKYEQELKEKEKKHKQREGSTKVKEIYLSPKIADNDLQVKVNAAKRFLEEGNRVQFKLEFKRREKAHKNIGFDVIKRAMVMLQDTGIPVQTPKLDGDVLICIIEPPKEAKE
jgi:translation initiation factor IF-3